MTHFSPHDDLRAGQAPSSFPKDDLNPKFITGTPHRTSTSKEAEIVVLRVTLQRLLFTSDWAAKRLLDRLPQKSECSSETSSAAAGNDQREHPQAPKVGRLAASIARIQELLDANCGLHTVAISRHMAPEDRTESWGEISKNRAEIDHLSTELPISDEALLKEAVAFLDMARRVRELRFRRLSSRTKRDDASPDSNDLLNLLCSARETGSSVTRRALAIAIAADALRVATTEPQTGEWRAP